MIKVEQLNFCKISDGSIIFDKIDNHLSLFIKVNKKKIFFFYMKKVLNF